MTRVKLQTYQDRSVAVLAGGAYVLSSIKDSALDEIAVTDFAAMDWDPNARMITIESKRRGSQARFGWVSADGRWLRYPSFPVSHGSVEAFKARVEEPCDGIRRRLWSPPVKLMKPHQLRPGRI